MTRTRRATGVRMGVGAAFAFLGLACGPMRLTAQIAQLAPGKMSRSGTVDERFQSYNIEMVEVTGGRFWKPYNSNSTLSAKALPTQPSGSTPAGMDPNLYQYRPPIDLSNSRLRKLAAALGPAYVRVSGTWANNVYFQASDDSVPPTAPAGFGGVLTGKQWKDVIDFARAASAEIVTSFATSTGTRDAQGVWTPDQAQQWLAYTKSAGGRVAAAEFMNEPTYAMIGGAPKGYDAAAFGRDIVVFRAFLRKTAPEIMFLGPSSVAEGPYAMLRPGVLKTEDVMTATGPAFDAFSYHIYATASKRCAPPGSALQTTAEAALTPDWLSRSEKISAFYSELRDRFEPGRPLWVTETADAACGGNPWASTFLDTFRYLVQHGSLAQQGVRVIMHNTLAASDYGLLDEISFEPRPNYWAALLWRKLMGEIVLNPGVSPPPNVYVYAHCLRSHSGGVSLLVINANRQRAYEIALPSSAKRYTLTAKQPEDTAVQFNGTTLELTSSGELPELTGAVTRAGRVSFAPASITFLAMPNAGNGACH